MFNGLKIGTSGMKAAQTVMDNVADQIANSSTNGYKKKEVTFSELLRNELGDNDVMLSPNAMNVGIAAGSRASTLKTDFRQGAVVPSEGTYHMAIEGNGYFGVINQAGEILLTRNGAFHFNGDRSITDDEGNLLSMDTNLSIDLWDQSSISIDQDGLISGRTLDGVSQTLGKVMLYSPETGDSLISLGEGKFRAPEGTGLRNSGDGMGMAFGQIRQRALEKSNVDVIQSMTDMIITQRAYQVNAKSVTTADEMLEVINTII